MRRKSPETMSIPEAGKKYLGLSAGGSWNAARRGEIPFIQVGRLKRVPVRAMERLLDAVSEPPRRKGRRSSAAQPPERQKPAPP